MKKSIYQITDKMLNNDKIATAKLDERILGVDYSNGIDCTTEVHGKMVDGVIVITRIVRDCCSNGEDL